MNHLKVLPAAAILAAALSLTACLPGGGGPAASLKRLDPMTLDTTALRAAVRLPETVHLLDGELTVRAVRAGSTEIRRFPLTVSTDPADRLALAGEGRPGYALTVFRLDAAQAAALAAWRTQLDTGSSGRLTLSISGNACRLPGPTGGPVPMTTYLAAAPADGYLRLMEETDLVKIAAGLGRPFTIAPCPAGS